MKLTEDQKIQIFCAALSGQLQADATINAAALASGNRGSGTSIKTPVEKASLTAAEAIAKLQSKEWS